MSKKHTNWVAGILFFVIVIALLSAFTPVRAFNEVNDYALQETPVVTVIVPTVVIPDTGGDGNQANGAFYTSLFFWGILILVLFVLLALIVGRSRSVVTERTVTTEHHDHYDE